MALALLLGQRGKQNKPSKGENFGCQFTANFLLESSTVRPYGKLAGQLIIETPAPISHYGIRIQYEALCTLKFESRLDNRVSHHKKYGNILEGGDEHELIDSYLESPILVDLEPIIKADPNENRAYELESGTNTYAFTINIPGDMLPAPFKNSYGTLTYKLVAYMRSDNGIIVQVGEKRLRFAGYHNLSLNPNALKPATLERYVKRYIFAMKKLVIVTLLLESSGYLPEEQLPFTMRVQNPKCLPFKMNVLLLQKATYRVDGKRKTTVAVIGSMDTEVTEPETETIWEGSLKVHKAASPTYTGGNPMYSVSHVVQVKLDAYNMLKADQIVYIGSTRDSVETLIQYVNNINLDRANRRRGSSTSIMSSTSATTAMTRQPSFSQLQSSNMLTVDSAVVASGYEDNLNELREPPISDNEAENDQNMNEICGPSDLQQDEEEEEEKPLIVQ